MELFVDDPYSSSEFRANVMGC